MSALLIGLCVDVRKEAEHFLAQCRRLEGRLLAANVSTDVQTAIAGGISFALLDHQAALDTLKRSFVEQRLCPGADTTEADARGPGEGENGVTPTSQRLAPYAGDASADSGGGDARITSQICDLDSEDIFVTAERAGRGDGAEDSGVGPPLELMQSSPVELPEDVVVQKRRPPKRRIVPRFNQDEKCTPQSSAAAQFAPLVQTPNDEGDSHQSFQDPQPQFSEFTIDSACASAETDANELIDGNPLKDLISALASDSANEIEPPTGQLHVVKLEEYGGFTPPDHGDEAVAMHATLTNGRADFYDRLLQCAVTETRRVDYTSGDSLTVRCFEGGGAQLFSDAEDNAAGGEARRLCPPLETLATAARQARAVLHGGDSKHDWEAWRRLASATHVYARTVLVYYERGLQRPVVYGTKIRHSYRGTAAGCVLAQPRPVRDAFRLAVNHLRAEFAVYSDADRRKVLEAALETLRKNLNKALSRHFQYTVRYQKCGKLSRYAKFTKQVYIPRPPVVTSLRSTR